MARQVLYGGVRMLGEGPSMTNIARLDGNALPMVHAMARHGIQVDLAHFATMEKILVQDLARLTQEIEEIAGHYVNPASGDQVAPFLYQELGLKQARPRFTPSGSRESTDNEALVAIQHEHPAVAKILEFKKLDKLRGTYVVPIPKLAKRTAFGQWRLFPNFKTTRVPSGRFCIAVGTRIEILRNVIRNPKGIPIEDVQVGDWAYTYDDNRRLTLRKVTWAGKTGTQRVTRIHWLGDGRHSKGYVDVTSDHEVRLIDGSYLAAKDLQIGQRVMSLSRGMDAWGYQRLWATGHKEIPKEHRFAYGEILGSKPEHIHHVNGNGSDNREENLIGMSGHDHIAYHGRRPSLSVRAAATENLRRYREIHKPNMRGSSNPHWLGLTKQWMIDVLYENEGRPTAFRDIHGIDYNTAKKYLELHHIDWGAIKRECKSKKNHVITKVEYLDNPVDVYDIEVDGTHNFIAGGICVHNSASDPNLLAMPNRTARGREVCEGFITDPGWVILSVDFSQLEPRIVAHRSQDPTLMAIYFNGEDIYSDFAIGAFKLDDKRYQDGEGWHYPGVDKKDHRFPSKTCILASIYRVSNKGLLEQMPVICQHCKVEAAAHSDDDCAVGFAATWNEDNCQEIINQFYLRYPRITTMQRQDDARAKRFGYVWDEFGRLLHTTAVRSVHPWIVSAALRESGNLPIQGTASAALKLTMAAVYDDMESAGYFEVAHPLLPIHDEILSEVREDVAEELGEHIAERMRTCMELRVPLDAAWSKADSWGKIVK